MVQGEGGLWGPHAAFNYDCQMRVLSLLFGLLFISKSSQLYSEWTRWPENLVCFADLILIWDGRVWTRCKKLISWQNYTETCRTRRPWTEADCFFPWHGAESCGSLAGPILVMNFEAWHSWYLSVSCFGAGTQERLLDDTPCWALFGIGDLQGGPLPVISRIIAPPLGVITLITHLL